MDEQRCTLNISPKSTPTHRPTQDVLRKGLNLVSVLLYLYFQVFMVRYGWFKWFHYTSLTVFTFPDADPEKFFSLLANSQGRRLDDQRLSLPALPGIQNGNAKSNSASEADAGNLCNVIAKAQVGHLTDWGYKRCFQDAFQVIWSVITELEVNSGSFFFSHRDQGWMIRDVLHPKSYRIWVVRLLDTKALQFQTHLRSINRLEGMLHSVHIVNLSSSHLEKCDTLWHFVFLLVPVLSCPTFLFCLSRFF